MALIDTEWSVLGRNINNINNDIYNDSKSPWETKTNVFEKIEKKIQNFRLKFFCNLSEIIIPILDGPYTKYQCHLWRPHHIEFEYTHTEFSMWSGRQRWHRYLVYGDYSSACKARITWFSSQIFQNINDNIQWTKQYDLGHNSVHCICIIFIDCNLQTMASCTIAIAVALWR